MSPLYEPYGETPLRTFIKVDLPAPFSPQMAWISPERTTRLTSARALTPGNSLVIDRISSKTGALLVMLPPGERLLAHLLWRPTYFRSQILQSRQLEWLVTIR